MAVARWLESVYQMDPKADILVSKHLNEGPSAPTFNFEDLDTDSSFSDPSFGEGEKNLLRQIFEHLRAGKLSEVMDKLQAAQCHEHYLMLNGTTPMHDNIEFKEDMQNTEDLFISDYERQRHV